MIALLGPEPGQGQGVFFLAPVPGIEPEIVIQGPVALLGGIRGFGRLQAEFGIFGALLQQALVNIAGRPVIPLPIMQQGLEVDGLLVLGKLGYFLGLEGNGILVAIQGHQQFHQLATHLGVPVQAVEPLIIGNCQGRMLLMAGGDTGRVRQDAPIVGLALEVPGQRIQRLLGLPQPIQGLGMNDQGPGSRVPVHHLAGNLQRGLELAGIEINPA